MIGAGALLSEVPSGPLARSPNMMYPAYGVTSIDDVAGVLGASRPVECWAVARVGMNATAASAIPARESEVTWRMCFLQRTRRVRMLGDGLPESTCDTARQR